MFLQHVSNYNGISHEHYTVTTASEMDWKKVLRIGYPVSCALSIKLGVAIACGFNCTNQFSLDRLLPITNYKKNLAEFDCLADEINMHFDI